MAKIWGNFDNSLDLDIQWEIMYQYCREILSVMCPYKKLHTHKKKNTLGYTRDLWCYSRKTAFDKKL